MTQGSSIWDKYYGQNLLDVALVCWELYNNIVKTFWYVKSHMNKKIKWVVVEVYLVVTVPYNLLPNFLKKSTSYCLFFYLKCMLSYLIPKYAKYFLVQNSKLPLRFDLLPRYSGQRNCGIENLISTVVKFRWYAKVFFCSVPYPAENKNLATITDFSSIISKKCKTRRLFQVVEQSIRSVFYWAFVRWRMFPSKKKGDW